MQWSIPGSSIRTEALHVSQSVNEARSPHSGSKLKAISIRKRTISPPSYPQEVTLNHSFQTILSYHTQNALDVKIFLVSILLWATIYSLVASGLKDQHFLSLPMWRKSLVILHLGFARDLFWWLLSHDITSIFGLSLVGATLTSPIVLGLVQWRKCLHLLKLTSRLLALFSRIISRTNHVLTNLGSVNLLKNKFM